jgi:hypothetical protein
MEPCEPMGVMSGPLDSNDGISVRVRTARFGSRGHASLRYAPIKTPRFRGVMEQFPQPLRGQAELPFAGHGGPPKEKRPAADSRLRALVLLLNFGNESVSPIDVHTRGGGEPLCHARQAIVIAAKCRGVVGAGFKPAPSRNARRASGLQPVGAGFCRLCQTLCRSPARGSLFSRSRPGPAVRFLRRNAKTPAADQGSGRNFNSIFLQVADWRKPVKGKIPIGTGFCRLRLTAAGQGTWRVESPRLRGMVLP